MRVHFDKRCSHFRAFATMVLGRDGSVVGEIPVLP